MLRLPALITAFAAALHLSSAPVSAQTMVMTDEERAAFGAEVRAYLMENPEVIFEAVAEFERRTQSAQAEMDNTLVEINASDIFADGHSWAGGNLEGSLTLVEFVDYRCGFCRRAYPQTNAFIASDGDVRLIIKEFPILGPESEIMSRFAIAVKSVGGDDSYYAAHEQLIVWDGSFTETSARLLAGELGVDAEQVLAQMNSDEVNAVLRANRELAQRLQISGTPSFVLGAGESGELLRGYLPADELQQIATRLRG